MIDTKIFLSCYLAFIAGYLTSRTVLQPVEYFLDELKERVLAFKDKEPYISKETFDKASDHLFHNYDEIVGNATRSTVFKICPKCQQFKRNFAKSGRKRVCMDCEFGEVNG